MPLKLQILTPEGEHFSGDVEGVVLPSTEGELGVLPEHIGLVIQLVPGELQYREANHNSHLAIGSGFAHVADNAVKILTDMALPEDDIDEAAAEEALLRAEKAMKERKLGSEEHATVAASLQKSLAQLKVKRRRR